MTPDYPIKALAQAWSLANRALSVEASHVRLSIEGRILAALRVASQGEAAWAFNILLHGIYLEGQLVVIDRMTCKLSAGITIPFTGCTITDLETMVKQAEAK